MSEQQINDAKKHGIESLHYLEHKWGSFMGRSVFEICKLALNRPMKLLSVFESAGKKAEQNGEFLSWRVPITNFPVVQHYVEGEVKKIYVQYGPQTGEVKSTGYYDNAIQISITFPERPVFAKGRQSQAASPNIVHSLDAAHLALTTYRCKYPITTIHDSYGALYAHMPELYRVVRETFVELYETDPLQSVLKDINCSDVVIDKGSLDVRDILRSEYCFV